MWRKLTRFTLALFALALVVGSSLFLRTGLRLRAECYQAESAQVLNFAFDAGRTGQYSTILKQIAAFPCKQYIRLVPDLKDGESAASLLRGLEFTIEVADSQGFEWLAGSYPGRWSNDEEMTRGTIVIDRPMPIGEYQVYVEVVTPAPALSDRTVRVTSGYMLCGIEWMGPTIAIGGGSVGLGVGTLIAVILFVTRRKTVPTSVLDEGRFEDADSAARAAS